MNKKPPELHLIEGTKSRAVNIGTTLPEELRNRIPEAEWMHNPDAWDKSAFVKETSDFLWEVYGIGNDYDKHILAMLADQIDTYVACNKGIRKGGVISRFNNGATVGPNPFVTVRDKTLAKIIQLMNEMGLTARSRLSASKTEPDSPLAKFLKGPLG